MLPSLAKYKIMYVGIHLILLSIVLYKLSAMGLLPVSAADYVDLVPPLDVRPHPPRPSESSPTRDRFILELSIRISSLAGLGWRGMAVFY